MQKHIREKRDRELKTSFNAPLKYPNTKVATQRVKVQQQASSNQEKHNEHKNRHTPQGDSLQ